MKVFYDCEFIEDGRTIDLISIGMVAEDGREYYAVNYDAPWDRVKANDWLVRNVLPSLPMDGRASLVRYLDQSANVHPRPSLAMLGIDDTATEVKPRSVIRNEVRDFLLAAAPLPELWAWYGAYDHVVLAQLFGPMITLPRHIPMWTHDLNQLIEQRPEVVGLPEQAQGLHNALADARHIAEIYKLLTEVAS